MRNRLIYCVVVVVLLTAAVVGYTWDAEASQPDKVIGTGTKGNLARWVDEHELGDSTITEDGGFFGVGSPINPNFKLNISSSLASPKATFHAGNTTDGRARY